MAVSITFEELFMLEDVADDLADLDVQHLRPGDTIERLGVVVQADDQLAPFARDGAGGLYLEGVSSGRVVYVSSEGSAGPVAASLSEFVALLVVVPDWREVLYHSANGQLSEMLQAARTQKAYEHPAARRRLTEAFSAVCSIPTLEEVVQKLHRACSAQGNPIAFTYQVDGHPLDGLLGPHAGSLLKSRYEAWYPTS